MINIRAILFTIFGIIVCTSALETFGTHNTSLEKTSFLKLDLNSSVAEQDKVKIEGVDTRNNRTGKNVIRGGSCPVGYVKISSYCVPE